MKRWKTRKQMARKIDQWEAENRPWMKDLATVLLLGAIIVVVTYLMLWSVAETMLD